MNKTDQHFQTIPKNFDEKDFFIACIHAQKQQEPLLSTAISKLLLCIEASL